MIRAPFKSHNKSIKMKNKRENYIDVGTCHKCANNKCQLCRLHSRLSVQLVPVGVLKISCVLLTLPSLNTFLAFYFIFLENVPSSYVSYRTLVFFVVSVFVLLTYCWHGDMVLIKYFVLN